jgi:peptidoglycan-associated lipoprotein
MTKLSTAQATEHQSSQRSPGGGRSFLVLIFRLLLLIVGSSFAGLLGIAVAQFYPAQIQETPVLEKVLQRSEALIRVIRN